MRGWSSPGEEQQSWSRFDQRCERPGIENGPPASPSVVTADTGGSLAPCVEDGGSADLQSLKMFQDASWGARLTNRTPQQQRYGECNPDASDTGARRRLVLVLQPIASAGHVEDTEKGSGGEQDEIHGGHRFSPE
jgi:hypothetical protein